MCSSDLLTVCHDIQQLIIKADHAGLICLHADPLAHTDVFLHRIGDLAGIGLVLEAQQHQTVRLASGHRLADYCGIHLVHIVRGAPCYITLSPSEKFVLTANYIGGSITVFPLDKDGKLKSETRLISFTGNSLDKERQTQPHLHCIEFTPDHKYLLASDLGTDQIHVFPVSENVTDGVSHSLLNESEEFNIKVESGSGPRHICFHPNQKFAYLINEISGKVIAFSYDKGKLNAIQYIEADTVGAKGSGDIHISPDGKFLYASNRLKADGIAIFSINQEEGTLTKTGYQLTGIHPRNFIISRNGRYLLVACRDSNSIQVFERDSQTGLLKDTGKTIKTNKPVCLKFTF